MRRGGVPRPPAWMRRLLSLSLPRRDRAELLASMDALWARRRARDGRLAAGTWYLRQAAAFPARLAAERGSRAAGRLRGFAASTGADLRHGTRVLRRRPGYALAFVLTLGVGAGGVVTVFAAADWVLLRPVPGVPDQERLVTLRLEVRVPDAGPAFPVSHPDLADLRSGVPSLAGLAGAGSVEVHVEADGGGPPRRVEGAAVTDDYFDVLGVDPFRGRLLGPPWEGDAPERDVVVLSHRLWRELGSAGAPGAALRLNGRPFTVAGVAPPGFQGAELPGSADIWLPGAALPVAVPGLPPDVLERRGAPIWTGMVGRLAPGAGLARVAGEAEEVMERIRGGHAAHSFYADYRFGAYAGVGLSPRVRPAVERTLALLGGAAGLLLLLAVANLGGLSLTHAVARAGSNAVHAALGAGRVRVARRVLAEHVLLAAAGTGVALLVALAGSRFFREASLSSLGASLQGMRIDDRVATVAALVALGAAAAAAVGPVLLSVGDDVLGRLRGRRHGSPAAARARSVLVVVQVALSAALLVGAGLLTRTVAGLRSVDAGFEADRALRFSLDPRVQGWDEPRVRVLVDRVEARLAAEPGVAAAGFVAPTFVRGAYLTTHLHRPGADPSREAAVGAQFEITPGFLEAAGIELLAGRPFAASDLPLARAGEGEGPPEGPGAGRVLIVSESLGRSIYPELGPADLVGRTLVRSGPSGFEARVVGVVEDLRTTGVLDERRPPVAFHPWGQGHGEGPVTAWVRVEGPPAAALSRVRDAVREVEPSLPPFGLRTARAQVDLLIVEQRVVGRLAAALAGVGLLLAGIGLHGVLGYAVASRRREIGVRSALGAGPATLVAGVVRRGLLLTAVGLVLGALTAVPLTRVVESRLFEVDPLDPLTFAAGAATLLVVAVLAAWAPARRATRVSPSEVLASE